MTRLQICEKCGSGYEYMCSVCLGGRAADDIKHQKKRRFETFIAGLPTKEIKGYIDDLSSVYIDPKVADVPDAHYASGSLGNLIPAKPGVDNDPRQLKLFSVMVDYDQFYTVLVLAVDEEEAILSACDELDMRLDGLDLDECEGNAKCEARELTGFKNGTVLSVVVD